MRLKHTVSTEKWGDALFYAACMIYIVLIAFLGSTVKETIPAVFTPIRLVFFLGCCGLFMLKILFFNRYDSAVQRIAVLILAMFGVVMAIHSREFMFAPPWLLIFAAKDISVRKSLKIFFAVQLSCVITVLALVAAGCITCGMRRAPSYGYYHYNHYASFILGLCMAWLCMKQDDKEVGWRDYLLFALLAAYIFFRVTARGAAVSLILLLLLCMSLRFLPRVHSWMERWIFPVLPVGVLIWNMIVMKYYDDTVPLWDKLNRLLTGRLDILYRHNKALGMPLFGDARNVVLGYVDNAYQHITLYQGSIMLAVVICLYTMLLILLARKKAHREIICVVVILIYGLTEYKLFELQVNAMLFVVPTAVYECQTLFRKPALHPKAGNGD